MAGSPEWLLSTLLDRQRVLNYRRFMRACRELSEADTAFQAARERLAAAWTEFHAASREGQDIDRRRYAGTALEGMCE